MKILLVQPPKSPKTMGGEDVFVYEPLALEYLAAGIDGNHLVKILDMRLDKSLESTLSAFAPDIVGFSAYTVHVNVVNALCEQVKRRNSRILTVVGGHHATVRPEDFLRPAVDVIVVGEGVFVFREIVQRAAAGRSLAGIPGTVVVDGNGACRTDPLDYDDLDAFPLPDRSLTKQYRAQYFSEWMRPLASLRTSKGCPFRCTFCAEWKVAGGRYYKRKPECIVAELKTIEEPYVFFADDESLIDAPRMSHLAHLIRQAGIQKKYFLYGRSDTIARHPDLLKQWREIGLERIFIGLESCREEDLRTIHKNSSMLDNARAIGLLRELGIEVYASFIVRPEASHEDFAAYKKYCRRMKLPFATFAVLTPLPGTDLYAEVKDRLVTDDYDYFDFIHALLPTRLPLREFYASLGDLYRTAVPIHRQMGMLRKLPVRDIPRLLGTGRRFYKRLATAHLDYTAPVSGREAVTSE